MATKKGGLAARPFKGKIRLQNVTVHLALVQSNLHLGVLQLVTVCNLLVLEFHAVDC